MTRSTRSIAFALLATAALSACATNGPAAAPVAVPSSPSSDPTPSSPRPRPSAPVSSPSSPSHPASRHLPETGHSVAPAPRIVSFRIAQRPKCPEGTAVFRAPAVPLIIEWAITGATRGALSVDDPTHTPGTYGPVALHGSQEFTFSCAGDVGTTETHTYALYTVGGGPMRSATITASAKVLDKGR